MAIKVALDAMGGDHLAVPNLQGACRAIRENGENLEILLCGPREEILKSVPVAEADTEVTPKHVFKQSEFESYLESGQIEIVEYPELVEMGESPSVAVRKKKNSSMAGCFDLVKAGRANAALSAGNSGAMMAYGIARLGRIENVKRPAILCNMPSLGDLGVTALLDGGANVDATPEQICQFARMGVIYIQAVYGKEKPRVALMNIGEEESKGPEAVKVAHQLLKEELGEYYVGFCEGRDVFTGDFDVVAADGFVGNIILKTAEGAVKTVGKMLKQEFARNPLWGMGAWVAKGGFSAMKSRLDYREHGAAPLIGLQGLGLVAHGSSDGLAIFNAIRMGRTFVETGLISKLNNAFASKGGQDVQAG